VIVDVLAIGDTPRGDRPGDADAAVRQLYSQHAKALHSYVRRFCPDPASADDIVQETFIRARSRLHYALQALRQYLQEHDPNAR
jgi:hypothetical protein